MKVYRSLIRKYIQQQQKTTLEEKEDDTNTKRKSNVLNFKTEKI